MVNSNLEWVHQCSIAIEDLIHDIINEMHTKESVFYLDGNVRLSINNEPHRFRRLELSKLQSEIISKIKSKEMNNLTEVNYFSFIDKNSFNFLYWLYKKMRLLYACNLLNAIFKDASINSMRTKLLPHDFITISKFYDWEMEKSSLSENTAIIFFSEIKDTFIEMVQMTVKLESYTRVGLRPKMPASKEKNESINSKENYIQATVMLPKNYGEHVKVSNNNVNFSLIDAKELTGIRNQSKQSSKKIVNESPLKFLNKKSNSKLKYLFDGIYAALSTKYKHISKKICTTFNDSNQASRIVNEAERSNIKGKSCAFAKINRYFRKSGSRHKRFSIKHIQNRKLKKIADLKKLLHNPIYIGELSEIMKNRGNLHNPKDILKMKHKLFGKQNEKQNIKEPSINAKQEPKKDTHKQEKTFSGLIKRQINFNKKKSLPCDAKMDRKLEEKKKTSYHMKQLEIILKSDASNKNQFKNSPDTIELNPYFIVGVNESYIPKNKLAHDYKNKTVSAYHVPIPKPLEKLPVMQTLNDAQKPKLFPTVLKSKESQTVKMTEVNKLKDISKTKENKDSNKKPEINPLKYISKTKGNDGHKQRLEINKLKDIPKTKEHKYSRKKEHVSDSLLERNQDVKALSKTVAPKTPKKLNELNTAQPTSEKVFTTRKQVLQRTINPHSKPPDISSTKTKYQKQKKPHSLENLNSTLANHKTNPLRKNVNSAKKNSDSNLEDKILHSKNTSVQMHSSRTIKTAKLSSNDTKKRNKPKVPFR